MIYQYTFSFPGFFDMTAVCNEEAITHLLFDGDIDAPVKKTPLLLECERQLEEYFSGKRAVFTLPLAPKGTPFQRQVWQALLTVPYGETRSYGQIAKQVGREKAARAVGGANHNNPISILIPCHRIIGADGSLWGYGGGLDKKKALLDLERKYKDVLTLGGSYEQRAATEKF